jgi:biotin carboxyl carrier protein
MSKADAELALADATRAETDAQGNYDAAEKAMIRDYPNTTTAIATDFAPPQDVPVGNESSLRSAVTSAERTLDSAEDAVGRAYDNAEDHDQPPYNGMSRREYIRTETAVQQSALDDAEDALSEYLSAVDEYYAAIAPYQSRVDELERLSQVLSDAKAAKTAAQNALSSITGEGGTAYYDEQIKTAEKNLVDKQIAIEKNNSSQNLAVAQASRAVADAQAALDKLVTDGLGTAVVAPVGGIVTALNVTPGQEITPLSAVPATIEMPENGYYLKFAVTNAQATNLRPGVVAEEINNWWGTELTYTLANISNDPDNPQSKKMLLFTVTGENISNETGRQHTLEIGAPAGNYDIVVPATALRTDAQGDFVLLLEQKSSPLGTRFLATRIDVNILAQDNTNAAVSGGLSSWDYVITVSSAPVAAGQYVRLAE